MGDIEVESAVKLQKRIKELEEMNRLLKGELEFFVKVYKNAPEPMILMDCEKNFIDVNPAACRFFEIQYEELKKHSLYDFLYMAPIETIRSQDKNLLEKGTHTDEWLIELANGKVKQVEFYAINNMKNGADLFVLKDVTSHKRLEWERSMHFQLFSNIFNQVIDGIIMFDETGAIVTANPAFCKSIGLEKEKIAGLNIQSLIPEKYTSQYDMFWEEFSIAGSFFGEVILLSKENEKIFEMSASSKVYNGLNMAILRDITDRKEMKVQLQKSEEKFRKVFHGTLDGMLLWKYFPSEHSPISHPKVEIVEINEAGRQILRLNECKDFYLQIENLTTHPNHQETNFLAYIHDSLSMENEKDIVKLRIADHTYKNIEFYSRKDIIPGFNLTIFRDVTERIAMEEQLRQSETLNVVGELAAGIAHEIRNPMTSLKGFIQLLKSSIDGYEMYFDIISSELERIESIVNELLVLAKPQAVQFKEVDIVLILQNTIELLNAQAVLANVQFEREMTIKEVLVYCEPNQIKQVFINIIKNAIEVMPDGGTVFFRNTISDQFIKISIEDQGLGMSQDKLKNLGKPFFSTKDQGTGLGLMVSYRIIEEHGGYIEVESKEGIGTVFHICLPLNNN